MIVECSRCQGCFEVDGGQAAAFVANLDFCLCCGFNRSTGTGGFGLFGYRLRSGETIFMPLLGTDKDGPLMEIVERRNVVAAWRWRRDKAGQWRKVWIVGEPEPDEV
jgi:hypothetical protein